MLITAETSNIEFLRTAMRNKALPAILIMVLSLVGAIESRSQIQLPAVEDTYGDTKDVNLNFGTSHTLRLGAETSSKQRYVFMRFDLSALPAGTGPDDIVGARLRVFTNSATTAVANSILGICSDWNEATLTWSNRPGICSSLDTPSFSTSVSTMPAQAFSSIDITTYVKSWARGAPNYGLVISPNGTTGFRA